MKALFCALFCITLFGQTPIALAQSEGVDNIKYYQTIHTNFKAEEDRSTLFLTLWVANLSNNTTQTEEAKARCVTLSELCQNSIKDAAFYNHNKEMITELVNSILIQQPPLFKEKFIFEVNDEYNRAKHQKYLKILTEFKLVTSIDSANSLMNDIENELAESRDKDSIEFISLMVNENLNSLVYGLAARLQKSRSIDEINRLFELTNLLIDRAYNPELEKEIAYTISEALKPGFLKLQNSLGELLLVGYGKFLTKHGKIPVNPSQEDVRTVYENIISTSNQITLNRNILFAQTNLLEKGILTCNTMDVARVQRGWSWASNDDRLNIIPFVMLNKSKEEIIQESKSGQSGLDPNSDYHAQRKKDIELFNYKFDKFSGIRRISRSNKPLIFDDPLLKLDEGQTYNGCRLIHFVAREGLYKFPSQ